MSCWITETGSTHVGFSLETKHIKKWWQFFSKGELMVCIIKHDMVHLEVESCHGASCDFENVKKVRKCIVKVFPMSDFETAKSVLATYKNMSPELQKEPDYNGK